MDVNELGKLVGVVNNLNIKTAYASVKDARGTALGFCTNNIGLAKVVTCEQLIVLTTGQGQPYQRKDWQHRITVCLA